MLRLIKHILLFSVLFGWMASNAQRAPVVLPSLLNNETQKSSDIESLLKQKMFVKVFTNKHKIFVGEPIVATYKFYVDMNLNDHPSVTKQPEFTGWGVDELNFSQASEAENIHNVLYSVFTIRKVQLTPLQQGMLSLGKAFVNNEVEVAGTNGPYSIEEHNITVSNAEEMIEVQPLPEKNKPENFYGITGAFNIDASVAANKIPVGESGKLVITIKGTGNFDAISKPGIAWPANVQHFDGSDSQHVNQGSFPVSGNRVFVIPFVGEKEGSVVIPPIHFSFFNTDTYSYQTISTDSIPVTFTKAPDKKSMLANAITYDAGNRQYLWIVAAIIITVALVGLITYKRNNKQKLKAAKAVVNATAPPVFAQPLPLYQVKYRTDFSRHLNEIKDISEHKVFFEKAKTLLTKAVAERINSNQYSEHILLQELFERTYNAPVCAKVASLYEKINLHLYAPFETEANLGLYFDELKITVETLQAES